MNLIRVMPAEGEMKNPTTTDQLYLGRDTNTPSHPRLLSRPGRRRLREVHKHAPDNAEDLDGHAKVENGVLPGAVEVDAVMTNEFLPESQEET